MGIQLESEIQPFKIQIYLKHRLLKITFLVLQFFIGSGYGFNYNHGPDHSETGSFEIWPFLSGFHMVSDKMAAIFLVFMWLGFRILDPIQNIDH